MSSSLRIHDYSPNRNLEHLYWQAGSGKILSQNSVFAVRKRSYTRGKEHKANFFTLECPDWVNVCPLYQNSRNEDCLVMVRQYRHGSNKIALELPGGVVNEGEDGQKAAQRELWEETGFEADTIIHLGSTSPNAAFMTNHLHIYCAENLRFSNQRSLDENEVIDVELVPISLILQNAVPEFLVNGIMAIAWYFFAQHKQFMQKEL